MTPKGYTNGAMGFPSELLDVPTIERDLRRPPPERKKE